MRATLRASGKLKLTIKVAFNVDRDRMIFVLAIAIVDGDAVPRSRAGILEMLRGAAFSHGTKMVYQSGDEDVEPDAQKWGKAINAATAIVDRVFPDLSSLAERREREAVANA